MCSKDADRALEKTLLHRCWMFGDPILGHDSRKAEVYPDLRDNGSAVPGSESLLHNYVAI